MADTLKIVREEERVALYDGSRLFMSAPAESASSVFEYALDQCDDSVGHIQVSAGRFQLTKPIRVDKPVTLEGAGYATKLIPPAGQYAIEVNASLRSPTRRQVIRDSTTWLYNMEIRTHGIVLRDLCIDGEGQGKGLSVEFLIEGMFSGLFIHRTLDGPGLRLGPSVMETGFHDIHMLDCGTPDQAAVSLEAQPEGDACNNVIFQSVFIIFPNGCAMEIGAGKGVQKPRLITLRDCMMHGWLPWQKTAKGPLLRISGLDPVRGLKVFGGRVTCGHVESPCVSLLEGRAKFFGVSFGGGGGSCAIMTKPDTHVVIRDCDFHGLRGKDTIGDIAHISGDVHFESNVCEANSGRLIFNEPAQGFVTHNHFLKNNANRPLLLRHGKAETQVVVSANRFGCQRDLDDADPAMRNILSDR
jgi:hypothetical protein